MTSSRTLHHAHRHVSKVASTFDRQHRLSQGSASPKHKEAYERSCHAVEVLSSLDTGDYDTAITSLSKGLQLKELADLLSTARHSGDAEGEFDTDLSAALAGILSTKISSYEDPALVNEFYHPAGAPTVEALATVSGVRMLFQMSLGTVTASCLEEESARCVASLDMVGPWRGLDDVAARVARAHKLRERIKTALPEASIHTDTAYLLSFNLHGDKFWVSLIPSAGGVEHHVWHDSGEMADQEFEAHIFASLDQLYGVDVRALLDTAVFESEKEILSNV